MDEFNVEMVTIELELWKAGIEYSHDGEICFVDSPYSMGVSIEEL